MNPMLNALRRRALTLPLLASIIRKTALQDSTIGQHYRTALQDSTIGQHYRTALLGTDESRLAYSAALDTHWLTCWRTLYADTSLSSIKTN